MNDLPKQLATLSSRSKKSLLLRLKRQRFGFNSFPLSFVQQRLWFLDQLAPNSGLYNIPSALRLTGTLDIPALNHSLEEIVRRHEALRTTFALVEGQPVQVIASHLAVPLPLVDLGHLSEPTREAEAKRLAMVEAHQPFDLAHGPLLRASLLRLGTQQHILLLTMHHIVSDGWSMEIFFRELTALYEAYMRGEPSPLEELPIQYADYALLQHELLQGPVLKEQLAYWTNQLAGAPAILELPTDRPRPAAQTFTGATYRFTLPPALTDKLTVLSRREGITLFMTMLTAFQALLARYSGQDDIVVGSPIAGRRRAETEGLIGFFVNMLALRARLEDDPTFREQLARTRETCLAAYANQDLPFERLVEALQPERNLGHNPLFQAIFALRNAPASTLRLPAVQVELMDFTTDVAQVDLVLDMEETTQGLVGVFEYSTDLFDAPTIARMAGHFQTLLDGVVTDLGQRLSELPLLTALMPS